MAAARANEFDPRDQDGVYEALQFPQSRGIADLGVKFYRGAFITGSVRKLREAP